MPVLNPYPAKQIHQGPAHDRKDTRNQDIYNYVPEIIEGQQKEQNRQKDQDIP